MKIRKATPADIDKILAIYQYAKEQMRLTGNPNQWKQNYPSLEIVERAILLLQFVMPTPKI